ncbi:hypothetical protein [uncultured Phenylobacterium sp.]|uniref:COG3650 family protein n=1 Tax=uncultured Phenylobacterium sp. TaxID=349273 RepID=UPI0025FB279F|nr:hypothetical protein [uncultured Phenylobacterium sp.]
MQRFAVVLVLIALAGCQSEKPAAPQPPQASVEPTGPATRSDFSQPMTARGNEPFWALTIDGTHLKLSRPDHPDLPAEAPGAVITPGQASWTAKAADGQDIKLTLYVSDCSDGMSDRQYPMTAEVALLNETLRGCADQTARLKANPGG